MFTDITTTRVADVCKPAVYRLAVAAAKR